MTLISLKLASPGDLLHLTLLFGNLYPSPISTMSTAKFIRKLLKRGDEKNSGATSTPLSSQSSARPLPIKATILQDPLSQSPSRLLSLPGELRNRIYALVIYPSLLAISVQHTPETVLSLPVFAICRQVRSEAVSKLCSSKSFSLFGLRTANTFLRMIGDGVSDLRFVTIRSETGWRTESGEMVVERANLLGHLELATSLRSLQFVVGDSILENQDVQHFENASSVGAQFLYAVRSVVDHERLGAAEDVVIRERFLTLSDQIGELQAVRTLKKKLQKEHEDRAEKVFRLSKLVSMEGSIGDVLLPLRIPEYLGKPKKIQ